MQFYTSFDSEKKKKYCLGGGKAQWYPHEASNITCNQMNDNQDTLVMCCPLKLTI